MSEKHGPEYYVPFNVGNHIPIGTISIEFKLSQGQYNLLLTGGLDVKINGCQFSLFDKVRNVEVPLQSLNWFKTNTNLIRRAVAIYWFEIDQFSEFSLNIEGIENLKVFSSRLFMEKLVLGPVSLDKVGVCIEKINL